MCCSDQIHCCPNGFWCDVTGQFCKKGSLTVPSSVKLESAKLSVKENVSYLHFRQSVKLYNNPINLLLWLEQWIILGIYFIALIIKRALNRRNGILAELNYWIIPLTINSFLFFRELYAQIRHHTVRMDKPAVSCLMENMAAVHIQWWRITWIFYDCSWILWMMRVVSLWFNEWIFDWWSMFLFLLAYSFVDEHIKTTEEW